MSAQSLIDINRIREWLYEAGKIALSQSTDRSVAIKSDLTPVTLIDKQIEDFLRDRITQHYPEHGLLAEEGSFRSGNDFTWVIDPIDGTRAFASSLPVWGISVGVFHQGNPYAGVFYMPVIGDMYWGSQDEAYCNDRKLVPISRVDLNSSLVFIAVPSNVHLHFDISFPRIRSLGSTTAHLAYVAHGMATAALTRKVHLWDLAALLPSLRISQTKLVYLSGKAFNSGDLLNGEVTPEPLIVAHSSIIDEIRACIHLKSNAPS